MALKVFWVHVLFGFHELKKRNEGLSIFVLLRESQVHLFVLVHGLIKNDMPQNCPLVMADYHTDIVRVGLGKTSKKKKRFLSGIA